MPYIFFVPEAKPWDTIYTVLFFPENKVQKKRNSENSATKYIPSNLIVQYVKDINLLK